MPAEKRPEAKTEQATDVVAIRLRDGTRRDMRLAPTAHAELLAELLHTGRRGLVEVVGARRGDDGRLERFDRSNEANFVPAGDRAALVARVCAEAKGVRREVFFTPATLRAAIPGNDGVEESGVAWVDIDEPDHLDRLRAFPHRPHAVLISGSGGRHAYWRLAAPVSGEACEEINRKLVAAVGADPASCNRGRIMRVPGTRNYKKTAPGGLGAWCQVVACDLASAGVSATDLVAGLTDPKAPRPVPAARRSRPDSDEPWNHMEPADYYRVITGLEPMRDGRIRCPSATHEDRHPSAKLYGGEEAGWYCFACQAGGRAPDLVAALRGWPTGAALRDEMFRECIAELQRLFGVADDRERGVSRNG